jgi:hypothetical protein
MEGITKAYGLLDETSTYQTTEEICANGRIPLKLV